MKKSKLLLVALASLTLHHHASASFIESEEGVKRTSQRTFNPAIKALPAPQTDEGYLSWGMSLVSKHRAKIATGACIVAGLGLAAYSYLMGSEEESTGMNTAGSYRYSYSGFDLENSTTNISLINAAGDVLAQGVCSLIKSYTADVVSVTPDCSEFFESVKSYQ